MNDFRELTSYSVVYNLNHSGAKIFENSGVIFLYARIIHLWEDNYPLFSKEVQIIQIRVFYVTARTSIIFKN